MARIGNVYIYRALGSIWPQLRDKDGLFSFSVRTWNLSSSGNELALTLHGHDNSFPGLAELDLHVEAPYSISRVLRHFELPSAACGTCYCSSLLLCTSHHEVFFASPSNTTGKMDLFHNFGASRKLIWSALPCAVGSAICIGSFKNPASQYSSDQEDTSLSIFDMETRTKVHEFISDHPIRDLHPLPGQDSILLSVGGNHLTAWDIRAPGRSCLDVYNFQNATYSSGGQAELYSFAVNGDGHRLAMYTSSHFACADLRFPKEIKALSDISAGKETRYSRPRQHEITTVEWSGDWLLGTITAAGLGTITEEESGNGITCINVDTKQSCTIPTDQKLHEISMGADGKAVCKQSYGEEGYFTVFDCLPHTLESYANLDASEQPKVWGSKESRISERMNARGAAGEAVLDPVRRLWQHIKKDDDVSVLAILSDTSHPYHVGKGNAALEGRSAYVEALSLGSVRVVKALLEKKLYRVDEVATSEDPLLADPFQHANHCMENSEKYLELFDLLKAYGAKLPTSKSLAEECKIWLGDEALEGLLQRGAVLPEDVVPED